jgi:hypothetical protein
MKQSFILSSFLVSSLAMAGCVVKTSHSSDPSSPMQPEPAPAPAPAAPSPAPATHAATPAPMHAAATPAPSAAAKPATPSPMASQKETAPPPKKEQPVFKAPPKPKAKPAERKADEANGVPAHMKSGGALGYWIWRDPDGVTWHLRTTAGGPVHRFSGRVWVDGTFAQLKGSNLEAETEDRLKKEDEGVLVFDFNTSTEIDGFDFKVGTGRCVTFHLLINEKPAPKDIQIGQKEVSPGSATFRLCK